MEPLYVGADDSHSLHFPSHFRKYDRKSQYHHTPSVPLWSNFHTHLLFLNQSSHTIFKVYPFTPFFFLIEGVVATQSFMSFNKKMLIFSEELFWVLQFFFFPDSPKNWLAHTSPLKDRLANCQNKLLSLFCCRSC